MSDIEMIEYKTQSNIQILNLEYQTQSNIHF